MIDFYEVFNEEDEWFDGLEKFHKNKHLITDERPIRIFDGEDYAYDFTGKAIDYFRDRLLKDMVLYLSQTGELGDYVLIKSADTVTVGTTEFARVNSLELGHKIGILFTDYARQYM